MSRIQVILNKLQIPLLQIIFIISIITYIISSIFKKNIIEIDIFYIMLIQHLVLLAPVLIFILLKKVKLKDFNFKKIAAIESLITSAKYFILYLLIVSGIQLISKYLNLNVPGIGQAPDYNTIFSELNTIQLFISVVILAPIVEEILFRGLIYKAINGSYKLKIILNSLVFAFIHFQFEIVVQLFILSLIISYIRYKTDNINAAIIFHAFNNLITFIALYYYI